MQCLDTELSRKEYLFQLKRRFSSPFSLYSERITGFTVGPYFSVAYYSPYEWNRRITNECNRAWGYVKEVEGKTQIHYIRGKGQLSPFWLLLCYLLWLGIFCYVGLTEEIPFEELFVWQTWIFGVVISLLICGISAFGSYITEAGIAGELEIEKLLSRPDEYYV